MRKMLFVVAALVLVACQQNTPKETASAEGENAVATTLQEPPNEAQVNPEEQVTAEVDNHWKELKIKGEVKVLTEIIYEGIEKNGQVVKDERKKKPLSITRTFFDSKGFMTLMERFKDLQMKKPYETEKYQYNEKGQLLETIISAVGGETQYTYSYNEQGDKILESFKDPYVGEPLKTEYHYEYTPEGKRRTQIRKYEDVKEIAYYDKKNVYVKKERYDAQNHLIGKTIFSYDEKGLLIKDVTLLDNEETTITYTYDTYGNLTSSVEESPEGTTKEVYKYQYDNKGNILQQEFQLTSTYKGVSGRSFIKTYTHDAHGNILTETQKNSDDMSYRLLFIENQIEYY